ncbi:UNVERIFIED_CONTAM: putative pterin-4-alpha-carbinolamine dehydratase, chloroplastic [Sesamum radiatum]|uniref:4a-hydroxytetrahydrobiopterin dehydratase n=1 Tax=Sesamum radiatum TaxID=300843 RepID=A0AAW2JXP5_SESRA
MASAPHLAFSPLLSLSKTPARRPPNFLSSTCKRNSLKIRATAPDLLGDFGARDPFPAELESNFGEKVLGNVSTEHKILIPSASALSLAQQECVPVSQLQQPMSEDDAKKLLFKVVGWKIVHEEGGLKLQGLWKVRDTKCGEELINRITKAVESTGHHNSSLGCSQPRGLSINDFIVAAKIDEVKVSDLQPRLRAWA